MSMLSAWKDCTSETRYPGCGRWKQEWSHEQRAFSEYIRHDAEFNVSAESIVGISCDDAVGWPGFKDDVNRDYPITECNGNFLRHHTLMKSKTKDSTVGSVMQALSQVLQKAVLQNKEEVWYEEPEKKEEEEVKTVDENEDETKLIGLITDTPPVLQEVREHEIVPILEEGVL